MTLINLNGTWKLRQSGGREEIPAKVPGSVYSDLLNAGKMEDPFYRENEPKALEISKHNFEYTRNFTATDDLLFHDRVLLRCEGLDTICTVTINGVTVLNASNMHRIYEVDVKNVVHAGQNTIAVFFRSPVEYIARKYKEQPLDDPRETTTMHGFTYLRKAQYMFGWDWGPKLPDMGIWRDIKIVGFDIARFSGIYLTQTHRDGMVEVNADVQAETFLQGDLIVDARITAPDGGEVKASVPMRDGSCKMSLSIENPQLWWPNGLGNQPLYRVEFFLRSGGRELDARKMRIGLRTLTVKTEKDRWGTSFAFTVNGVSFFAMGADYIPEDNILSRCNEEKSRALLRDCVKSNFNTIRIWGGGYYPPDYFYDLCDEYGLVVWQDLMFACGVYDYTEDFRDTVLKETADNVKRIRHHACLGLWCGNNEQESGWTGWGWSEKYSPRRKADYIKQYEVDLPALLKKLDPNTFWWPSSPSSGGCFDDPSDESRGDEHYWDVWHGLKPFTEYRTRFPRFMSEFGLQSFPCLKTVKTFTEKKDRNIFSPVMESHQKNSTCNGKILHYISECFRYPENFDSLLYVSQLIQAVGIKYGVEHWRRNRGRCMGSIYWQINDCWPVASWASRDYFGRWKALQYYAKRFFAPVLLSACDDGLNITLNVSNETKRNFAGTVVWNLKDSGSGVIRSAEIPVSVSSFSAQDIAKLDFGKEIDTVEKRRACFFEYELRSEGKTVSHETLLFVKDKHYDFQQPEIQADVKEQDDRFVIQLHSKAYARYVELSLSGADGIFSDDYFDLPAGEDRKVELLKKEISVPLSKAELEQQLVIRSLYDTYTCD